MKKNKVFLIIGIILLWNFIFGLVFYFSYMNRVEKAFGNVKGYVMSSKILKSTVGTIREVKFDNFMQWTSNKDSEKCIKLKVIANGKKHSVCAIINNNGKNNNDINITGYFINNKRYNEITSEPEKVSISSFLMTTNENKMSISSNDIEITDNLLKTYEEIINSNTVKNKVKQFYSNIHNIELERVNTTGILKATYVCKNYTDDECIDINNRFVSTFINDIKNIYRIKDISIVNSAKISTR